MSGGFFKSIRSAKFGAFTVQVGTVLIYLSWYLAPHPGHSPLDTAAKITWTSLIPPSHSSSSPYVEVSLWVILLDIHVRLLENFKF